MSVNRSVKLTTPRPQLPHVQRHELRMRQLIVVVLCGIAAISLVTACGSPSTPSTPVSITGLWAGSASDGGITFEEWDWQLTQVNQQVTGTVTPIWNFPFPHLMGARGQLAGALSNQTLTFTISFSDFTVPGPSPLSGCHFAMSGSATLISPDVVSGHYTSASNCAGPDVPFLNGDFRITRRSQ